MMKKSIKTVARSSLIGALVLCAVGCETFDASLATAAALEAVQAATLTDDQIRSLSRQAAAEQDTKNPVAPASSAYAQRLNRLVQRHTNEQGIALNYKVYLSDQVNAFAMADGTVRVYSGLMDKLKDDELLFVIGHEVGHVVKGHSKRAAQVAYTASAARKGAAALGGTAGSIAQSEIGALSQQIITAQFSQHEEKDADDFGLSFMKRYGYPVSAAVSALRKLGDTGGGLLSSHPNPQSRADRLAERL
jgi:putative metalloprotease